MTVTAPQMPHTPPAPSGVRSRGRRLLLIGVAVTAALGAGAAGVAAGAALRSGPPVDTGPASLTLAEVPEVGQVLVDQSGRVLYLFDADEPGVVTCTGGCAREWPPLTLAPGQLLPDLGAGVDPALVDVAPGDGDAQVVTYDGSPLYRYDSDDAGEAGGHDTDQDGGRWFAVTASGERAS